MLPTRVTTKIKADDSGCWLWAGALNVYGYGRTRWKKEGKWTHEFVHRLTYEAEFGEIPEDLQIDHLCRNRACCNPLHLEAVTLQENLRRGETGALNRDKTHCDWGHEFTKENTYLYNGGRYCRACQRRRRAA